MAWCWVGVEPLPKLGVIQFVNSSPPGTKWPPCHRRHFRMHFYEWKVFHFNSHFTEVCSSGSNWQKVSIGSGNGLAPVRRQAITWTNADPVHWRIYAALGGDELKWSLDYKELIKRLRCMWVFQGLCSRRGRMSCHAYHFILWSLESIQFRCWNYCTALKFDRCFSTTAAETPVKFQSNQMIWNLYVMTLRFHKICW